MTPIEKANIEAKKAAKMTKRFRIIQAIITVAAIIWVLFFKY